MKALINFLRIIVGVFFIFSGLLKANDPIGLSYKMQEFFTLWGMNGLNSISLWLSVLMIAFEIIAGFALLLGWKPKLVSWLLLLLIVFFTFLTGYAYLSGKFKTCGCMGDCLPITPGVSFLKDIILLVLIILIFLNRKYVKPVFSKGVTLVFLLLATVFSFASQWYTLNYLPVKDCLPFRKGNSIPQLIVLPNNAIPDSTSITFVYEKGGKEIEFGADNFPADFNEDTYKFIKRYDKILKAGSNNVPPITGFVLTDAKGNDKTHDVLRQGTAFVLFIEDMTTPAKEWQPMFEKIYKRALEKNIEVYAITSTRADAEKAFSQTGFKDIIVLNADRTMIRTAARTNPVLYLLREGVVADKWPYREFEKVLNLMPPEGKPASPPAAPPAPVEIKRSVTGDSVNVTL